MNRTLKCLLGLASGMTLVSLTGCSNTLVFAERTKAAIAVDIGTNPAEPIQLTAGYKRTVLAYVPPKGDASEDGPQKGEALSLVSIFNLGYKRDDDATGPGGLMLKNAFASGKAAQMLAGNPAAVNSLFTGNFVKDKAGDDLRSFWKPDGTTINQGNEQKIRAWMDDNDINTSITFFMRSDVFKDARQQATTDLVQ